jgi:hypothetical protein
VNVDVDTDLVDDVMRLHGLASRSTAVDHALSLLASGGSDSPVRGAGSSVRGADFEPLGREAALALRGSGWQVAPSGGDPDRRPRP